MGSTGASQRLVESFSAIKTAWPPGRWEWDARFGCVLTTLKKDVEAQGRAALSPHLGAPWARDTLKQAPAVVQAFCAQTGGLTSGQMVFATEIDGVTLYALWWPWRDGSTSSVRLGTLQTTATPDPTASLRSAFGV